MLPSGVGSLPQEAPVGFGVVIQAHPKWVGPADATLSRGEQADVAIASDSDNEEQSKRLLK